jgi:dsDNA-binding SOS-regulon protein
MPFYAKIIHEDEGVVAEKEFATKAEADAYVDGVDDLADAMDAADEPFHAVVSTEPAKEAE